MANRDDKIQIGIISFVFLFYCSIVGAILTITTLMFEYSLNTIFGKDVPWYLDLLGALVLNGANLLIWFVCLLYNTMGYPTPIFG